MSTPANFDPIARPYRWLEYLTFGPYLERCRFHLLPELAGHRHALVLGDGDGRFTARLLALNPHITIHAIDSSPAMLRQLTSRVEAQGAPALQRLQTETTDAVHFRPHPPPYDLVVTHFFLDCLSEEEICSLTGKIAPHLAPGASWLISEFAIPTRQPAAFLSRLVVGGLYRIFRLLTGLQRTQLPAYEALLRKAGWSIERDKTHAGGLLRSQLWSYDRLAASNAAGPVRLPEEEVSSMLSAQDGASLTYSFASFPGGFPEPAPGPAPDPDPAPLPGPGIPGLDPGFPIVPEPAPAPLT